MNDRCVLFLRYELTVYNHCNITLVTKLRREDNNRRWRCQVNTRENSTVVFLDLMSAFLFEDPPPVPTAGCSDCSGCSYLPISRIVLCVALPVMVLIVGFFTWKADRKRAKTSAAGIELWEVSWLLITVSVLVLFLALRRVSLLFDLRIYQTTNIFDLGSHGVCIRYCIFIRSFKHKLERSEQNKEVK